MISVSSDSVFTDHHDIISLKLYQLTVFQSQKEEEEEEEITIPSVDNFELLRRKTHTHTHTITHTSLYLLLTLSPSPSSVGDTEEGMSGIAIFFTVLFSMLGCIFLIVIGLVVYSHWHESRRKRFYWAAEEEGKEDEPLTNMQRRCWPAGRSSWFQPEDDTMKDRETCHLLQKNKKISHSLRFLWLSMKP